jgi:hypothetical protein
MLTNTHRWSHTRGNTVVPYRWQATNRSRNAAGKPDAADSRPPFGVVQPVCQEVIDLCCRPVNRDLIFSVCHDVSFRVSSRCADVLLSLRPRLPTFHGLSRSMASHVPLPLTFHGSLHSPAWRHGTLAGHRLCRVLCRQSKYYLI